MDGTTHFNAAHNTVHISVPRRTTDSGYLNPINAEYINEGTVPQQNECEEIHHITNNPTYVNSGVDATIPGVDATVPSVETTAQVPHVSTAEQQDVEYERNGTHNLSGWLKQHKIFAAVVFAVLVAMATAAGVATAGGVVSIMMAVTKENTAVVKENNAVVKDSDKSESSPATTLLVTKEGIVNDMITKTPVTSQPIKTTPSVASENTASLVIIGGLGNKESLNTVDIYRLDSGRIEWSRNGTPSPFTGYRLGTAVDNGDVYVLGGKIRKQGRGITQYGAARYSVADNTWQQLPNVTWNTWKGPAVFIYDDKLYSAHSQDIWSLELTQASFGTWTEENIKLPHRVRGPNTVVSVGERIFIIGGSWEYSKSVISWRPGTDEPWRSLSDMNVARDSDLCSVTDGVDRIWVMAGCERDSHSSSLFGRDCSQTGFIEMYRVSTNTWMILDVVHNYFAAAQICGYHDGYIYTIFHDNHFHIYNTMENTWSVSDTELRTNARLQAGVVVT